MDCLLNITCKIVIKTPYLSHVASEDRKSVILLFPHRSYLMYSSTITLFAGEAPPPVNL